MVSRKGQTRLFVLLALLAGLSGCGADGEPERPAGPGVTVSGTVEFGITGGDH